MSAHGANQPKGKLRHLAQAVVLVLLFGLLYIVTRAVPNIHGPAATIAAVGFLLLAGTLASELGEPIGLPHLTGYLAAGIIAGPHVLKLVDHHSVEELTGVNALALALIALAGGAELKLEMVRKGLKSLGWHTLCQTVIVCVGMAIVFFVARRFLPFAAALPLAGGVGVSILWGVLSVTRSPSATLGILSQTRATGPLAMHNLTFVMSSDVVVIVLVAVALTCVRPLLEPGASMSVHELEALGRELLGSVAVGTTLGLVLAAYMRLIGKQLILVFVALGFGATEMLRYLRFDALLVFLCAGFVVMNLSKQGDKLLHAVEDAASVVFVLFFATAGAHLDIPILKQMWPVALALGVSRAVITFAASRVGARLAGDPPSVVKYSWMGLVSQAGVALGIGQVMQRTFPSLGNAFGALVVACVALNEMIGPILFKIGLERAGETASAPERASRPSLAPAAPP